MLRVIDVPLQKVYAERGYSCIVCDRKYPDTILNIEAVIHHGAAFLTCTDTKECKRYKRKHGVQKKT